MLLTHLYLSFWKPKVTFKFWGTVDMDNILHKILYFGNISK